MAHAGSHDHHITAYRTLLATFIALVVLTVTTVVTSQIDLGAFNVPLALSIAVGKASIVVAFFMGLKYDNKVNLLVLVVGIMMVMVFIIFTLLDTAFRGDLGNVDSQTIEERNRQEEVLRAQEPEAAPAPAVTPDE
jgi:cytochrome c oxidase subunit 4